MELQALGAFWQILVLLPSLDKSRRWNCRQRWNRKHGFVTRFVAFIKNRRPRRRCSHGVLAASVAIGSIAGDGKHSATALTGESDKARGGNELQNCSFESRFSTRSSAVHRLKSVSQPGLVGIGGFILTRSVCEGFIPTRSVSEGSMSIADASGCVPR